MRPIIAAELSVGAAAAVKPGMQLETLAGFDADGVPHTRHLSHFNLTSRTKHRMFNKYRVFTVAQRIPTIHRPVSEPLEAMQLIARA